MRGRRDAKLLLQYSVGVVISRSERGRLEKHDFDGLSVWRDREFVLWMMNPIVPRASGTTETATENPGKDGERNDDSGGNQRGVDALFRSLRQVLFADQQVVSALIVRRRTIATPRPIFAAARSVPVRASKLVVVVVASLYSAVDTVRSAFTKPSIA